MACSSQLQPAAVTKYHQAMRLTCIARYQHKMLPAACSTWTHLLHCRTTGSKQAPTMPQTPFQSAKRMSVLTQLTPSPAHSICPHREGTPRAPATANYSVDTHEFGNVNKTTADKATANKAHCTQGYCSP